MATTSNIVKYNTDKGEVALSIELVRRLWCPNASTEEAYAFIQLCRYHGLNPHLNEAYIVKYAPDKPASFLVGKEAFLNRASHHPNYKGFSAGVILESNGEIEYRTGAFCLEGELLLGGWAEVYRNDRSEPVRIEVSLHEYDRAQSLWRTHPATMIRKVAVTQAHREAFPGMFAGMYEQNSVEITKDGEVIESTGVILESAENDVSAPPKPAPPKPERRLSEDRPTPGQYPKHEADLESAF